MAKRRNFTPEFIVKPTITYTPAEGRGYKPRQRRWGSPSLTNYQHIFGLYYKAEVVLEALRGESSQAELCRRHNLSEQQLSKWKQQVVENVATLFVSSTDQQSSEAAERIAHLEQLVGRLTVALDIQKKALTFLS